MNFNIPQKSRFSHYCSLKQLKTLKGGVRPEPPPLRQILEAVQKPLPFDPKRYLRNASKKMYSSLDLESLTKMHTFPAFQFNDTLVVYSAEPGSLRVKNYYLSRFNVKEIKEIKIDYGDVFNVLESIYREEAIKAAITNIEKYQDRFSAKTLLHKENILYLTASFLGISAWMFFDFASFFLVFFILVQLAYFGTLFIRLLLCILGSYETAILKKGDLAVDLLKTEELPLYTILVPVYKEENVIGNLLNNLKNLDYPKERIEVLILMEEDDEETLSAVKKVSVPKNWHPVIVPPVGPKTKPKACNYGLQFAQGEQITIYDAEDLPDSDQLKKAVAALRSTEIFSTCAQSKLNFYNQNQNIITRLFTLEYSYHFDVLLPGLSFLRMPIPLGGTSNHFRTEDLRIMRGWDPYNVTEDADLGMRLFIWGTRLMVIDSTTYEEANCRYWNWVRQRSRWLKGFMQTAIVYNRSPLRMKSLLGWKNWLGFQYMVTLVPVFYLINPIMITFTVLVFLLDGLHLFQGWEYLIFLSFVNIMITNSLGIYLSMYSIFTRKKYSMILYAFISPLYWIFFHSIAAYKALWQLITNPHYWEKTEHGLSKLRLPIH